MADPKLIGWGRAVRRRAEPVPPLWLFTDTDRMPDPRMAVRQLPRGMAGVVFRHDRHPDRLAMGRDLARICRQRRNLLVVAGDVRLARRLCAGVHLRAGRWPGVLRVSGMVTSSAHSTADLIRASRAGASLAFLSPVFATASHPGQDALGPVRWARLASSVRRLRVAALGGVTGRNVRRLGRCPAVGAIGGLATG